MLSMKEAYGFVAQHIKELYESAYDIRLEEIDHPTPMIDREIEVTVSFLLPASPSSSGIGSLLAVSAAQNRIFKKVVINAESGEFISLKMLKS
ncbi:hypothetical protein M8S83_16400 [Enterobacter asburiae]|uniref:hypothetical protein n=1 Tax=Enterobacter asburiae TaxID=61645 RepID=UPI002074FC0D|nr:hypothetical protein [Enterobacter asburiae]MCM7773687.1 hypothetical protein [Enterobacter asburiae]